MTNDRTEVIYANWPPTPYEDFAFNGARHSNISKTGVSRPRADVKDTILEPLIVIVYSTGDK